MIDLARFDLLYEYRVEIVEHKIPEVLRSLHSTWVRVDDLVTVAIELDFLHLIILNGPISKIRLGKSCLAWRPKTWCMNLCVLIQD